MDLKNNSITVREILKNKDAKKILFEEFPQYAQPIFINMAQNITLSNLISLASTKYSEAKINSVIEKLKNI